MTEQITKISLEKLNQIEQERNETMANPEFIEWFRELKIGSRMNKLVKPERNHFSTDKIDFQFKF